MEIEEFIEKMKLLNEFAETEDDIYRMINNFNRTLQSYLMVIPNMINTVLETFGPAIQTIEDLDKKFNISKLTVDQLKIKIEVLERQLEITKERYKITKNALGKEIIKNENSNNR